jgi:hypothetical membrane protein
MSGLSWQCRLSILAGQAWAPPRPEGVAAFRSERGDGGRSKFMSSANRAAAKHRRRSMKPPIRISLVASVLSLLCYTLLAFLALGRYPQNYGPAQYWLSDLGSAQLNPNGAWLYNASVVAAGLLLPPFFLGLSRLKVAASRPPTVLVGLTQVFGLLGAGSMILRAVYPIDQASVHSFWSAGVYVCLGTAFAFSAAALLYRATAPRWLMGLSALAAVCALGIARFQTVPMLEWVTVTV